MQHGSLLLQVGRLHLEVDGSISLPRHVVPSHAAVAPPHARAAGLCAISCRTARQATPNAAATHAIYNDQ
eukprot:3653267-Pleurochrysis_carterae.AAC.8